MQILRQQPSTIQRLQGAAFSRAVGDHVGQAQVVVEVGRFEEGEGRMALAGGSQKRGQVLAQVAAAMEEIGQGDDFAGALGCERVNGVSDAGRVAIEIGEVGEGITGRFVQPGGEPSDRLVGVRQRGAVRHHEEGGPGSARRARCGIDGAHALEGDGGQFLVEAKTGGHADGQLGELGGDFGYIAGQVLLHVDAVDQKIGLDCDRGCAGLHTLCDRFGDGRAAKVEETGLGDGRNAPLAQTSGQPDHRRAAVAVQAAVADEDDGVHETAVFSCQFSVVSFQF